MNHHIANSIRGSLNVITGCGSGLGKATLERFLRQGSGPVLAIDRQFESHFVSSLELDEEQKSKITLGKHDTFDETKTAASLEQFVTKNGPIDNLINVAGVALAFTFFAENKTDPTKHKLYDLRHANDLVEFNTVGTFNMIRLAAQYMIDQGGETQSERSKCIVNTSCISTSKPSFGQTFYAASKNALDSMTLCIAREFSPVNIRCNTINVGYFDTRLIRSSESKICDYLSNDVALCPKRLGDPKEFAHLVQSIIENKMLNGACIKIDACAESAQDRPHGKMNIQQ